MKFKVVIVLVVVTLLNVGWAQDFNWRQFEGTQIRFLMNQHPFTDFIQPLIPEFEELTGIEVTLESFPEDQFRQRTLLEASSGADTLDGYMIQPGQTGAQYLGAGWVRYIDDFLNDPNLTNPDLAMDDFFEGATSTFLDGEQMYGLPLQIESSLLFYRDDLLKAAGFDGPPETLEQLREYADKLNGNGVAGFAMRGSGANATSQIVNFLYSYGGKWLNEDGTSALDSEASQETLSYYADLLRNDGPAGVTNMSWPEVTSLYAQGQAAMMFDANVFRSIMEDPEQTLEEVSANTLYAPLPEGPAGRVPAVLVWGLSINHASQNPEAAWYFLQWALSKENQLKALLDGVPAARPSAWENEEFKATAPQSWIDASQLSFETGQPDWNPPVVQVSEVRDAYGQAIVAALQGQEVGPALEQANEVINGIISR